MYRKVSVRNVFALAALLGLLALLVLPVSVLGSASAPGPAALPKADLAVRSDLTWGQAGDCAFWTVAGGVIGGPICLEYQELYDEWLAENAQAAAAVNATPYLDSLLAAYGNAYSGFETGLQNAFSGLNDSSGAFDSATEAGVYAEWSANWNRPGATFNPYQALDETGAGGQPSVAGQIASVFDAELQDASTLLNATTGALVNRFATNGNLSGSTDEVLYGTGACSAGADATGGCKGAPYGASGIEATIAITGSSQWIYVAPGTPVYATCPSSSSVIELETASGDWQANASIGKVTTGFFPSPPASAESNGIFELPLSSESSGCIVGGPVVLPLSLKPWNGVGFSLGLCGEGKTPNEGCNPADSMQPTPAPFSLVAQNLSKGSYVQITPDYGPTDGVWLNVIDSEIPLLLGQAVSVAQVYYDFLVKNFPQGPSTVPSDCAIPLPSVSLPPELIKDLPEFTPAEVQELYLDYLTGLENFFGLQNATNVTFCSGHNSWPGVGGLPWSWSQNITGYALTLPIGSQVLSDQGTWKVHGPIGTPTQLLVWPDVATYSVPVGAPEEILQGDPLTVYPVEVGGFYNLVGNVSANGTEIPQPGAAIYISTCTSNGVPQDPCVLDYNTVNGTVANITCPNGPGSCYLPPPPVGTGGASVCFILCGNPLGWLSGLWGDLTSWLGAPAAAALALIIFLFIALAILIVGGEGLSALAHRKGSGSAMGRDPPSREPRFYRSQASYERAARARHYFGIPHGKRPPRVVTVGGKKHRVGRPFPNPLRRSRRRKKTR